MPCFNPHRPRSAGAAKARLAEDERMARFQSSPARQSRCSGHRHVCEASIQHRPEERMAQFHAAFLRSKSELGADGANSFSVACADREFSPFAFRVCAPARRSGTDSGGSPPALLEAQRHGESSAAVRGEIGAARFREQIGGPGGYPRAGAPTASGRIIYLHFRSEPTLKSAQ